MNLKKAVARASLAGGVGLALMSVGAGVAYADQGPPGGGGGCPPVCGPGGGGPGRGGPPPQAAGPHGPAPQDFRRDPGGAPGGRPGDPGRGWPGDPGRGWPGDPGRGFNPGGPDRPPGDWHPGGPGDWHPGGPGDWHGGPPPPGAFRGWRDAPWGDGPAPWGWGAPPHPDWDDSQLPPPGAPWTAGPINYWGFNEQPIWDQGFNQWGFWLFGIWIPL